MVGDIRGFFDDYRWLSNFWISRIYYDGDFYPSVEHAFQAAKAIDFDEKQQIINAPTPSIAKRLGKHVSVKPNWEKIKVDVMLTLLRLKFQKGSVLANKLLDTGNAYLEETNNWKDRFWGVCDGKGENILGKLLMQVRSELRGE